ncbi:MAG: hypothetical protein CM1200mP2_06800 [Planctomycetaceae bacterium]|nr:MAG: hypothetical protein CM1200mP2_06800 [Planctomycetaceae bacterium]
MLKSLFSTGHSDRELLGTFNTALGASAKAPNYNQKFVKQLSETRPNRAWWRVAACCSGTWPACRVTRWAAVAVDRSRPDGDGTTLSAERIAEELLWPNRQVKEGFSVIQVVTEDGKIHQGYERKTKSSQETGDLVLEDLATRKLVTIKRESIEAKKVTGSVMPSGLTAVLSREQLLDLLRFLSDLGKIR